MTPCYLMTLCGDDLLTVGKSPVPLAHRAFLVQAALLAWRLLRPRSRDPFSTVAQSWRPGGLRRPGGLSKLRDQAGTRGPRKQPQLRPERLGVRTWASRAPAARLRPAPRHQLCGEPALGAPRTGRQGVPAGCPACDPAPAHKRGGAATRPARSPCARQASRHLLSLRVFCPALPLAGREKHLGSSPVRLCTKPRSSTPVAAPHVHSVPPAAASAPHPWKYCGSAAAARYESARGSFNIHVSQLWNALH
nr:uncharacterized protein LOC111758376 [Cavia porcellus]